LGDENGLEPGCEIHDIRKTLVIARRPKGAEAIQKGFRTRRAGLLRFARNDRYLRVRRTSESGHWQKTVRHVSGLKRRLSARRLEAARALGIEEVKPLGVDCERQDVAGRHHHGAVEAHRDERLLEPGLHQGLAAQMLDELDVELDEGRGAVDQEMLGPDADDEAPPVLARKASPGK